MRIATNRNRVMHALLAAIVCIAMLAGGVSIASADATSTDTSDVTRDTVMDMGKLLYVYDRVVPPKKKLDKISSDPALTLMAVYDHDNLKDEVRLMALKALNLYSDDGRLQSFLQERLAKTKNAEFFRALLMAYARNFGEKAVEEVASYLDARDAQKRIAAVSALGMFGGQSGYELLRELDTSSLDEETATVVRQFAQ